MTGENLPNEEKANKAIGEMKFESTPFNGEQASGKQNAKASLAAEDAKNVRQAFSPGQVFEEIMNSQEEQGRTNGMRR